MSRVVPVNLPVAALRDVRRQIEGRSQPACCRPDDAKSETIEREEKDHDLF